MKTSGHSIEVTPGSEQVVVRVNGIVVARSERPMVLTETGSPVRHYLPAEDVATEKLVPSDTTSHCPFKGDAVYWSVRTDDGIAEDVVWSYPEPKEVAREVAGLLAFWTEKPGVDLQTGDGAA